VDKMPTRDFITVQEATELVLNEARNFGNETIDLQEALGRVLAQDIVADRDIPAFHRVAMDGIAVQYNKHSLVHQLWSIQATQAAGQAPLKLLNTTYCIEIMTGASLPSNCDTVIPYEHLTIENGVAALKSHIQVNTGQNIHNKAKDASKDDVLLNSGKRINSGIVQLAASVGLTQISLKQLPKIAIITTGDEAISPELIPLQHEIRQSNDSYIRSILFQHQLQADHFHLRDSIQEIEISLKKHLTEYDSIILTGGVSMGKFDYLPGILEELGVSKIFHKIQQRPGKPFWFGKAKSSCLVFGFPGNPVSTALCMLRYFIPWLNKSLDQNPAPVYAKLDEAIDFDKDLSYFALINLELRTDGMSYAQLNKGNGSGDFISLATSNAFLELSPDDKPFEKGKLFQVWAY